MTLKITTATLSTPIASGERYVDGKRRDDRDHVSRDEAEELEEEAAERNPDEQTRREALELELMEEDRSEAGEEIGEETE
jgi:hypothetical protein